MPGIAPGNAPGILFFIRYECLVFPNRHAIFAPVTSQRPAGQRFARIPLALPEVKQCAGSEAVVEPAEEIEGEGALVGAEGGGIPFGAVRIVKRNEGWFSPHREPH